MLEPTEECAQLDVNPFQSPSLETIESGPHAPDFRCGFHWLVVGGLLGLLVEMFYLYEWSVLLESTFLATLPYFILDLCQAAIVGPGLILFAFAWWYKTWASLSPGQWLWIAASGFVVGKLASAVGVATGILNQETGTLGVQTMLEYGLANLLGGAFLLFVLRKLLAPRAWRSVAWVSLAYYVLGTVSSILAITYYDGVFLQLFGLAMMTNLLHRLWAFAVVLFVVMAAGDDLVRHHSRDAVHYVGLIVPMFVAASSIVYLFL